MTGESAIEFNFSRVVVFAAHPDDEVLGVGGTLCRLAGTGCDITVVTLTRGETGYSERSSPDAVAERRTQETADSDRILAVNRHINLGRPTQALTADRETYQECVQIIRQHRPSAIFTHWSQDRHKDHRITNELADEARWKADERILPELGDPWYVPILFYFEIFDLFASPSHLVDISDVIERKVAAIARHVSQAQILGDIGSYVQDLARVRGYQRGSRHAEALQASTKLPTRV